MIIYERFPSETIDEMEEAKKKDNILLIDMFPFISNPCKMDSESGKPLLTLLDSIPCAWRAMFGRLMCEEIMDAVTKNHMPEYRLLKARERFGSLYWVDMNSNKEIDDIVEKYVLASERICMGCGEIGVSCLNDGNIIPLCSSCFAKQFNRPYDDVIPCTCDDYRIIIREANGDVLEERIVDISETMKRISNHKKEYESFWQTLPEHKRNMALEMTKMGIQIDVIKDFV